MKPVVALFALSLIAACSAQLPLTGGSGQTTNGQPLAGQLFRGVGTEPNKVTILSPSGWSCQSEWLDQPSVQTAINLTLDCTNGARGNAILSGDVIRQQATVSFQLTNGTSGQVNFGS